MHRPIILLFAFFASSTLASPALQPGDIGLRHDIQVLADYGVIRGPVTTWPLSWDAIVADLRAARDAELAVPVPVQQTLQRLLARAERETQRGQPHLHGRLAAALYGIDKELEARLQELESIARSCRYWAPWLTRDEFAR